MQVVFWMAVIAALAAAAAMGAMAWRMARGARERESARVELLRMLALADGGAMPASSADWMAEFPKEPAFAPVAAEDKGESATSIFAEHETQATPLPRWMSLSAVGVAMTLLVTLYAATAGGPGSAAVASSRPIELIALQQKYSADGFSVSGVVRLPEDAPPMRELVAVVNLFDASDHLLTSQSTRVERAVLEAGQSAAFSLTFPRVAGTVARYRVGFRAPGRDTIAHVDRRAAGTGVKAPTS